VAEPTVAVGHVTRAHGIRGEVAVEVRSDNPNRFTEGAVVFSESGRSLTIQRVHAHGSRLLVKFAGVEDRTAAEALRGEELLVPESWLPELPEGEYWPFQLEGSEVVTESGRSLGTVTDVIPNPANDLWVAVDGAGAETLVPAIADVIVDVDVRAKRIVVRDVPGLTVPDREDGGADPPTPV
jgi:16S rRNA processing protein RimM